ncbi:kinetochore-associated protein 1-like [Scylla paramamosain]|uniref:kinetochore-associated protein 1-like n=1 Tax=Scylla paramamosain TaxID=85552 RepID=UPI00308390AF
MVAWEVLDAECDEETRQAKDQGSLISLYEVIKLTYFHPSEQVEGLPLVSASAGWGQVAVALDQMLFVLGENCSSLVLHLTLEEAVSLVLWAPQGEFLMVGDVAGRIHYIHVASHKLLTTRQLPIKKKKGKVFVGGRCFQASDGSFTMSLATSCGQIFSLNNIDNVALSEGLRLRSEDTLKTVAANITLTEQSFDLHNTEVSSVESGDGMLWLYCASEDGPILWSPSSLQDPQRPLTWTLAQHSACRCIIPVQNARYLVVLSKEGTVAVVCGVTGLTLCEEDADRLPILDMKLLQEVEDQAQFLFLLEDPDSGGCLMRIVSFPGFTTIYELGMTPGTSLVTLGEGAESILFLEPEVTLDTKLIKSIKMKSIVDGVPEARLAKLLVKHKFKEAEEFCGLFQLDVEEVHRSRAQYLCDLLNPWHTTNATASLTMLDMEAGSSLMEELLATLEKIRDAGFVTTICIEAPMTNLASTKRILSYAKERLAQAAQSEVGDKMSELMQRVCETFYRLRTFETVFPSSDIQHWLSFSHADMLEECLEHLIQGNLDVVSTFWHRHQYEFSHLMDEEHVAQVLASIPHNIPSSILCQWLPKNILADLVMLCRSSLDMIAIWADEWVKKLEVLEKTKWPACGLNLANTIITVLENVSSDFLADGSAENTMAGQVAFSPSAALQQLQQTAHALQDLQLLASKFRIKIKLNQYTQDDKMGAVSALLDCLVCGEEVASLMDGFLRGFFVRHQLDQDLLLSRYILETLASADQDWWAWQEAPWEDKLYAIIDVMSDTQLRAEVLLECVRVAPVPWSKGTQAACELGVSLNTSRTSQLEDQRNMVGLKLVLRRYSLHMVKIEDPRIAEMILRNIVSHDKATVMEDALHVVNSYRHLCQSDAYVFRAIHLLTTRDIDSTKELLLGLNDSLQKPVCQKLIIYMTQMLLHRPLSQKMKANHEAMTKGVIELEAVLMKWVPAGSLAEHREVFSVAPRLHALQTHYNLYPTLSEMEDRTVCKTLLQDQVTAWFKENVFDLNAKEQLALEADDDKSVKRKSLFNVPPAPPASSPLAARTEDVWAGMSRLQWLASLLGVARSDLLSHLASLSSRSGRLEEAIQICQKLLADPSIKECSSVVYQVVRLVVEHLSQSSHTSECPTFLNSSALQERETTVKSHANLINIVYELVSAAQLHAPPDLLYSVLELGSWCQVGQMLYSQCHVEGVYTNGSTDPHTLSDPYTSWRFSPLFCDASIPIEDLVVLPVVTHALKGCLISHIPTQNTNLMPYQNSPGTTASLGANADFTSSLQYLVTHLHERGQDLLALQLCLKMVQQNPESLPAGFIPDWKQVFTILLKVIGTPKPDITLAIGLLLLLPKKEALRVLNELIRRFGFDYIKLMSIGAAGKDYSSLLGLTDVKEQFEVLVKRAQWGKRLSDMNVSFKEAFRGDTVALKAVVSNLVSQPTCTFPLLHEYCEDFGIDVTDSLLCYLQTTLHSWSPVVPDKKPLPGEVVQVEPPHAVLSKCEAIIAEVKSKALLFDMLSSEVEQLSPYNYELIHLVLQQLITLQEFSQDMELHRRGLDVISFLKVYPRQAPPSNAEVDEWIAKHPQSQAEPDIAKYRLPFHEVYIHSSSFTKTVEAELNISTLDIWLQASHILKLNADHMCLSAVHNTVSKTMELEAATRQKLSTSSESVTSTTTPKWRLCSSHSNLLAQVSLVICRMQDYQLAAACCTWMVNRLPPGADKVEAVKRSCMLVQQWKEDTADPKAVSAHAKMEKWYQQLGCEHALHKHGLAEPQYLSLTRSPRQLITALYHHPALSSLSTLCTHSMPDINACVSEICTVTQLQKVAILLDLLEQWLPAPEDTMGGGLDETVTNFKISLDPTEAAENTQDNTSLSRVIYLLKCCPQEEAVSYLLQRALSEDTSIPASHCLRALRCLLAIADEATIQKKYPQGIAGLRNLLKSLKYVSRLEALGHTSTVQHFNGMDKNALVEGLWRTQRHNPKALCLITDICHDYKVTAASLWGALLMQLTHFVKIGQLEVSVMERVLVQLKSMPHLLVVPALTTAWTTLIAYPFTKAVAPVSETSLASCVHSVDLLLRHCPVVVSTAPLLQYCADLSLSVLGLAIAAADLDNSHDLQSMVEAADYNTLKNTYLKLKPQFAFPKRVEELLE